MPPEEARKEKKKEFSVATAQNGPLHPCRRPPSSTLALDPKDGFIWVQDYWRPLPRSSLSVCLPPPGQTCASPPPGSLTRLPRHFNYPDSGILKVTATEWGNVCNPSLGALSDLAPRLFTQVLSPQSSWWREGAASFPASFTVPCPVPNAQLVGIRSSQTGPLVILCLFLN